MASKDELCDAIGAKDSEGVIEALVDAGFDDLIVRRVQTKEEYEERERKRLAEREARLNYIGPRATSKAQKEIVDDHVHPDAED